MKLQPRSDNAETIVDGLDGGPRPAPPPERIGAYRLEDRLGIGGMGEVFLAWDEKLQRRVAIKRIRQDIGLTPEQRERFRREAQLAARLSHSNVVQIHDLVSDGPHDAIVMELIEGRTVEEMLAAGRLETAEVLRLAAEIAEGLAAAHEAGLIHRDLKAANILITRDGHAKILDFGLARPVVRAPEDQGFTRQGVILGTCHAMSPEQARGEEVDERSDLFSFGALVHEMLTGRPPFRGNDHIDSLRRVVTEDPVDPRLARPDLPAEAANLLRHLLAKDREKRPASARQVIEILERLRTAPSGSCSVMPEGSVSDFATGGATYLELPVPFHGEAGEARSFVWTRRRTLVVGAAVVLLAAAAVALFFEVTSSRRRQEAWDAVLPIQKRVEAGEVRREDLAQLDKIIGISPEVVTAWVLAARISRALFEAQRDPADINKATELIHEAMERFPQDPAPFREAVRISLATNRIGDAEMYLERLEDLAPHGPEILVLKAGLAERQGRTKDAEGHLIDAVQQDPSWQNRYLLAVFYAGHGRIGDARRQIDKILENASTHAWALERLGALALSYGDLGQAEQIYKKLLNRVPARAYGNLATILQLRGRFDEAVVLYLRALDADPDHIVARINLAEVEAGLGHDGEADKHYNRALRRLEEIEDKSGLSPSDALWKAQCLARLGRAREAVEITERKSGEIRDDTHLLFRSALIYSLAGERAAALEAAEAALDNGLPQRWFSGPTFHWLRESPELRSRFRSDPASL